MYTVYIYIYIYYTYHLHGYITLVHRPNTCAAGNVECNLTANLGLRTTDEVSGIKKPHVEKCREIASASKFPDMLRTLSEAIWQLLKEQVGTQIMK